MLLLHSKDVTSVFLLETESSLWCKQVHRFDSILWWCSNLPQNYACRSFNLDILANTLDTSSTTISGMSLPCWSWRKNKRIIHRSSWGNNLLNNTLIHALELMLRHLEVVPYAFAVTPTHYATHAQKLDDCYRFSSLVTLLHCRAVLCTLPCNTLKM